MSIKLKETFFKYLVKIIVNLEKIGYIYSYPNIKSDKKKIKIWEEYLAQFDIFERDINMNFQGNKIDVKLNTLPLDSIIYIQKIINSKKDEYQEQENRVRKLILPSDLLKDISSEDEEDEPEYKEKEKLINEYFKDKEENKKDLKYEIIMKYIEEYFDFPKDELVDKIISKIKDPFFNKHFKLLFDEYCFQYYLGIIGERKNEYLELIKFLISLRFSFNNDDFNKSILIKNILWLEIYKETMIYILNILRDILKIEPNTIELIKQLKDNNEVNYIISDHHPEFKKQINYPFLIYLDSISFIILEYFLKNEFQNIKQNLNLFSNIINNAEFLNLNLRLYSKDFYRFKLTYKIIELLDQNNINDQKEFLNKYIKFIFSERKLIKENKIEEASKVFNNQYELLSNIFKNKEGFEKLMISLIVSKYKEVNNEKFRAKLCNIIIKNKNLLKFSTQLFVIIFKKYKIKPSFLEENNDEQLNPFSKYLKDNAILKEINGEGKEMSIELKDILRRIFKFKIEKYFLVLKSKINSDKNNEDDRIKKEIEELIGKDSFECFKNAYENLTKIILNDSKEIYNKKIKEKYSIVYCHIYFQTFIIFFLVKLNIHQKLKVIL